MENTKKIKILHLDDDEVFLDIFQRKFGEWFEIISCSGFDSAVEEVKKGEYDVVVSDFEMPGRNGLDFLQEVKSINPRIPIIFLTGQGNEQVAREAFISGASDYFNKYFRGIASKEKMINSVKTLVEKRRSEEERNRALLELQKAKDELEDRVLQRTAELQSINESLKNEVAKRESVQEKLKKSEEFLNIILNALDDQIFVKDEEHRWVVLNDSACKSWGYPREELIGKSDYDLFPREQADVFWKKDEQVFKTGVTNINEEDITMQGKLHRISTKKSVFVDSDGKKYIAGLIRDITDRKRMEDALRQSEMRFRAVFEAAKDAFFIKDTDLRYTLVNPALANLHSKTVEELTGKTDGDIYRREDAERIEAEDRKVLRGETVEYENTVLINNKERSFHVIKVPLLDENGGVAGICGIARDTTKKRMLENALIENEEKYRTVFENTGTATIIIESDGTVSLANNEFSRLSAMNKEEIEGKLNILDMVEPEDRERVEYYHHLRRESPDRAPRSYEFRLIDRDGVKKNILTTVAMIPGSKRSVASMLDISDSKTCEASLKNSLELPQIHNEPIMDSCKETT